MIKIIVSGVCVENHHKMNKSLALLGCSGGAELVDEITYQVCVHNEHVSNNEIALAIGNLVLDGFTVSI